MDWSTVLVLAAVTWLDGVRRVPAGALVLRRVLRGGWTVDDQLEAGRTWRPVSWWSPITLALVIPRDGIAGVDASATQSDDVIAARLEQCRYALRALRALGALGLAALVIGLPAAIARFGAWGFVAALGAVLLLAAATSGVALRALTGLGHGWRRAARIAAPLVWPFTAPRACELLLEHAVAGATPLVVARRLLGPAGFAAWVRPQAYDVLRGDDASADATALAALIGRPELAAIVNAPPTQCVDGESYCRRCARVYRSDTGTCAECGGLRLVRTPEGRLRLAEAAGNSA